jgi:hypothetical protein
MLRYATVVCATSAVIWICPAAPASPPSSAVGAARVLASAREAYGDTDLRYSGVLVEKGTEQSSGLTGRWRLAVDSSTGRMHETVDYGVYQLAETWDETHHWRQDHSRGVHPLNSAFARANAISEMWLARRGFLRTGAEGARIEYLTSRQADGRRYERLRATPKGGQPIELWFDRESALLARSVWVMPIEVTTVRYDDYRRVGTTMVPFRVIRQEGDTDPERITVDRVELPPQPAADEFAPPRTPDDSTVAGEAATVRITYDGDVVVEAMLNGRGPFGFILDTGGHDILTPDAAKALGLLGMGAGSSGGAGAGTLPEQYTRVRQVDIGAATLRDQSFIIVPLQFDTVEQGAKSPLAGILGVELFERFAVELNYGAQTLTLRPLHGAPLGHGVPVAITFTDDQPILSAKINGMSGDNGLDTGNSGSLVVQGRWARSHGLAQQMRKGLLTAGFGAGGVSKNWASRTDLELAGITFRHIAAHYSEDVAGAFSSRTEAGNIGNEIYEHFILSFDYGRGTVWFDPAHPQPQRQYVYSRAGISVYKESPDAFTVASVLPRGPAAEAGIETGDLIVAVNGMPATVLSGWDFRRMVREPSGTKVGLGFTRNGQKRSTTVTLRELLP